MAMLTVFRDGTMYGGLRKLKFLVDGDTAGVVGRDDSLQVQVTPGPHVLSVKMDWARSPELAIVAGETDIVVDVIMPGVFEGTWKSFLQPGKTFGLQVRSAPATATDS